MEQSCSAASALAASKNPCDFWSCNRSCVQQLAKAASFDKFHHKIGRARIDGPVARDFYDIRMGESFEGRHFLLETVANPSLIADVIAEYLERAQPSALTTVARPHDGRESPDGKNMADLVTVINGVRMSLSISGDKAPIRQAEMSGSCTSRFSL